ncbi:pterocarpan synthase 1 [Actinidia eriantha]|uniref:pterocarpan synthase 1 n=1 Tax=Actinidia eriantha TaxID=165200 RepID=UPI002590AD6F|nr:pterocarpan synthase 1 [Actinidia eriantha]
MLARIIFCTAASIAILIVVLLALYSPVTHRKPTKNKPWLALSLYIQQSQVPPLIPNVQPATTQPSHGALVFHRKLTEGPENTSRVVGKAQGFIIPVQHFSNSDFNLICLTFDTRQYSGSLSVESKNFAHKEREKLTVVGGTGSFAFARGFTVFSRTNHEYYHLKLHLEFPNRSHVIPG